MTLVNIKINGKAIQPLKPIKNPILGSKNVLTNSKWEFVELWLKKEKKDNALFYWIQAKEFNKASLGLSTQSSPLLHYYSFMNATKALLSAKNIIFNNRHGVSAHNISRSKISLSNEAVKISTQGILPALSLYLGETETITRHTLQDIFFNLPYIHRTYCLSYSNQRDMFIPLKNCEFVQDTNTKETFFRAILSEDFSNRYVIKKLPSSLILDSIVGKEYYIRSSNHIVINKSTKPTELEKIHLNNFHETLRKDLYYINGSNTLWYAKSNVVGPPKLNRFSATLTLAAMHRLSELCRYKPLELNSFLSSQKNWLLNEFILQSPDQFIDEIASEITGHQFLQPNIRNAS